MPNSESVDRVITYEVVHSTQYDYSGTVSVSHHLARLVPRALPNQNCVHHKLHVDPAPGATSQHDDYFGNPTTFFVMQSAHRRLTVRARSIVERRGGARHDAADTLPWERGTDRTLMPLEAIECAIEPRAARLRSDLR